MANAKNVLFIAVDDLRPNLGAYGHGLGFIAPHIRYTHINRTRR